MRISLAGSSPAIWRGFWIATILTLLGLASALANPVIGALQGAIFLAVAWGIRRGQGWAAITGAAILAGQQVVAASRVDWGALPSARIVTMAASAALALACAWFLLQAAMELTARPPRWPWFVVIAAQVLSWLCLQPFSIPTGGMEDTILNGDRVLVERVSARFGPLPRRDDIVVFRYPLDRKQVFVKRIAGVPGDRLRIRNKQLFRNGSAVQEPFASHKTEYTDNYRDNFPDLPSAPGVYAAGEAMLKSNVQDGELVVPAGKYFVLGDNRDSSLDSRYWGFVSGQDIIGKPVLIYASYDERGRQRWRRLLKRP